VTVVRSSNVLQALSEASVVCDTPEETEAFVKRWLAARQHRGAHVPEITVTRKPSPPVTAPRLDSAPEPFLPLVVAADRLGLKVGTLRQRCRRDAVRSYRVRGTGVVVPLSEVERLLAG
jgi:hypothetical protein